MEAVSPLPTFHLHRHRPVYLHRRVRRLRAHGTIARAEHREPPLAFELVMKLARVLPALAYCLALGMVLVGAPVSAADPAEEVAAPRDSRSHSYNIGVAITSAADLNFELSAGENSMFGVPVEFPKARKLLGTGSTFEASAEWSPGIANWSHYEAKQFAIDLKLPNFTRGVPLTVLGQRVVVTRFALGRNRVRLRLSTAF